MEQVFEDTRQIQIAQIAQKVIRHFQLIFQVFQELLKICPPSSPGTFDAIKRNLTQNLLDVLQLVGWSTWVTQGKGGPEICFKIPCDNYIIYITPLKIEYSTNSPILYPDDFDELSYNFYWWIWDEATFLLEEGGEGKLQIEIKKIP